MSALDRRGVWRRAGFEGVVCGLNLREALAALPSGLDRDFARRLLHIAEAHYLAALDAAHEQGNAHHG